MAIEDGIKKVVLDRERTLRMDFNALSKAEELTGKNFVNAETWRQLTAKDYVALAWACLTDEDSSLTKDQVGKMIVGKKGADIINALFDLYIGEAAPISEEGEEKLPLGTAGESGGQ